MERFSIVLLMTMFLANTVIVSAWATSCDMDNMEMSEIDTHATINTEPCDINKKSDTQNPIDCCEGLCLCFHSSVSQTVLPLDSADFPDLAILSGSYNLSNEQIRSLNHSPDNPPPKSNS